MYTPANPTFLHIQWGPRGGGGGGGGCSQHGFVHKMRLQHTEMIAFTHYFSTQGMCLLLSFPSLEDPADGFSLLAPRVPVFRKACILLKVQQIEVSRLN